MIGLTHHAIIPEVPQCRDCHHLSGQCPLLLMWILELPHQDATSTGSLGGTPPVTTGGSVALLLPYPRCSMQMQVSRGGEGVAGGAEGGD